LRGKHSFKFGGEFRRFYNNNFGGDAGTLTFLNVTQFINGTPNGFGISPGSLPSRIATGELGFFAQDSWKVIRRFTLELGLRYDWNQTPTEALNRFVNFVPPASGTTGALVFTSSPYQQNDKNFQPRVGFAFDVFGSGKTIVRSGYALLTDEPITNLVLGLTANPPLGNPIAFTGGSTSTTTYPNLIPAAGAGGLTPTVVDPNFKNSYIQSYNFNIQQQMASKWSLMVGYFGSKGTHLRTRVNLNQLPGVGGLRPFQSATIPGQPTRALGNISDNVSIGNSRYNALWVTSNLNSWHGLQFNANYTFSKSLDYTSQNGQGIVLQDSLNPAGDRGLSDFNARHRYSMNFLYGLPFKRNRLLEGWQAGSIIQWQTGNPVNLFSSGLNALTGLATLRPDQVGPIRIVNQVITSGPQTGNIQWFANSLCDGANPNSLTNPCSSATFALPTGGGLHFGNFGRNVIIGPGFSNVDFSLIKRTKITERFSNELRIEAFDVFNHANFGQPGRGAQLVGGLPVSTFGVISSTRFLPGDSGSARQLQFAVKLIF